MLIIDVTDEALVQIEVEYVHLHQCIVCIAPLELSLSDLYVVRCMATPYTVLVLAKEAFFDSEAFFSLVLSLLHLSHHTRRLLEQARHRFIDVINDEIAGKPTVQHRSFSFLDNLLNISELFQNSYFLRLKFCLNKKD